MEKSVIINNKKLIINWHKTAFLERHLKENSHKVYDCKTIIEIGAYNCSESIAFTLLFPNSKITAFECKPKLAAKCRENIEGIERIKLIEAMVTDTPKSNFLYLCNGGLSSMCKPINEKYSIINVPTIRMDKYLDDSIIDFLWIDVQGAELNVLNSFGEKLKNVMTIYCEVDIENNRYDSNSTLTSVSNFLMGMDFFVKDTMILDDGEAHIIFERRKS